VLGIENIGCNFNRFFLKDSDKLYLNLVYGICFLVFFIGILLCLNIYNVRTVIILLTFSFILKIINFNFCRLKLNIIYKELILITIALILLLISIKTVNFNYDDLSGYFFTIAKYINGREYVKHNLNESFREYYLSPLHIINGIFVYLSNFYSANFFDRFLGFLLTILIVNDKIITNSIIKKNLLILISLLSVITINETASGKLIVIPFTLLLLFKIEEFYLLKKENNLLHILLIASTLYLLKPISIISFANIFFVILLINKILRKLIDLKKLFLYFFITLIFLMPYLVYSYKIDFGVLPNILINSKYYFFNNEYFKSLNLKIINQQTFINYYFISRQNYLIIILAIINLIILKKKYYLNVNILFSLIIFESILSFQLYPDNYNQLRYSLPFYQSLFIFILINNYNNLKKIKLNFTFLFYLSTIVLALKINSNFSINSKLILYDLNFLFTNDYENIYSKYKKFTKVEKVYDYNYSEDLNEILYFSDENKYLLLISKPYLMNSKNFQKLNLNYVEYGTGFVLSDINYPIYGSYGFKKNFFDKKSIKYIIIEKNINKKFSHLNYNSLFKEGILNNYNNRCIECSAQYLFYTDLLNTVSKIKKIKVKENNHFTIWKII